MKFCSLGTNIQVYMYFVVPDDNFNDYLRMQSHVTKDGNPARIPPLVEQVGQYVLCTTFSVHRPLGILLCSLHVTSPVCIASYGMYMYDSVVHYYASPEKGRERGREVFAVQYPVQGSRNL